MQGEKLMFLEPLLATIQFIEQASPDMCLEFF